MAFVFFIWVCPKPHSLNNWPVVYSAWVCCNKSVKQGRPTLNPLKSGGRMFKHCMEITKRIGCKVAYRRVNRCITFSNVGLCRCRKCLPFVFLYLLLAMSLCYLELIGIFANTEINSLATCRVVESGPAFIWEEYLQRNKGFGGNTSYTQCWV